MLQPGKFDLVFYRGDTYTWRCVLWEDIAQSIPTSLSGAIAKAEIRDKTAGTYIVALNCVITLPNIIDITFTTAMWATCPSKGVWDLQLTFPGNQVRTVLAGAVTVTADVTDSAVMPALVRASAGQRE